MTTRAQRKARARRRTERVKQERILDALGAAPEHVFAEYHYVRLFNGKWEIRKRAQP